MFLFFRLMAKDPSQVLLLAINKNTGPLEMSTGPYSYKSNFEMPLKEVITLTLVFKLSELATPLVL